jgi:hypothetical protein
VISLVRRAFWPPSPARCETHRRKLDTSVGVSGPHDFAVHEECARLSATRHGHRIPPPRS